MGLEFLLNNGAHRMRDDAQRPLLLDNDTERDEELEEQNNLAYEQPAEDWRPIDVDGVAVSDDWDFCPRRFIDGKDLGRTVAWLQTEEGHPIPVRLSEIGAVVMWNNTGCLRREWYTVERVVSMIVDPFPWDEVESFAAALQEKSFACCNARNRAGV